MENLTAVSNQTPREQSGHEDGDDLPWYILKVSVRKVEDTKEEAGEGWMGELPRLSTPERTSCKVYPLS